MREGLAVVEKEEEEEPGKLQICCYTGEYSVYPCNIQPLVRQQLKGRINRITLDPIDGVAVGGGREREGAPGRLQICCYTGEYSVYICNLHALVCSNVS